MDWPKSKGKKHDHSWMNGINAPKVSSPDYKSVLLSSPEEVKHRTDVYLEQYHKAVEAFKEKTSLTSTDMKILMFSAALQTLRWALLSNEKMRFDKASDADKMLDKASSRVKDYVPATVEQILSSHTVPYDAMQRSEHFMSIHPDFSTGVSGANHRYMTLGHDPIAGLLVGTANIATNTLTVNDFSSLFPSYHVFNQQINGKTDLYHIMKWSGEILMDSPSVIAVSFGRQIVHCGTDIFTKQGLPLPGINILSPEASKFLIGARIDVYSVGRAVMLSIVINKIVEMIHRLFFEPNYDEEKLYEVRTRKILTYSNTLSSILNIGYVGLTRNPKNLDVGGLLITLWRIITDAEIIRKIQWDFVNKTLDGELRKEEDEINQRLSKWGFSI